jgi:iron complex outermembrane receptor protein
MIRFLILSLFIIPFFAAAQVSEVSIIVTDYGTKETVPFAKVSLNKDIKGTADVDGKITFSKVNYGDYMLIASLQDSLVKKIKINQPVMSFVVAIGQTLELEEIQVIGGLVTGRRTPVPVTRIDPKRIEEELGSRDIPMLLNATPGVYATQQGGGDGDSRITVRGFSQRNVGVMIDGVPVNDMENGSVYWSNWFGLDVITQSIQVQRGLGATKLAMPSVGGTLNIQTAGVGNQRKLTVKQEYSSGNMLRTSLAYNSGMMKKGWGVTLAGSFKKSDGWVDGTPSIGGFYYAKVQKKYKKHLISFSAFGAPQKHGQRAFNQKIPYWSTDDAEKYNVNYLPIEKNLDRGIRYNEHYGYVSSDYAKGLNSFKIQGKSVISEKTNYYNKNQFTLKDFWQVNNKLSISNIVYASVGSGGGTKLSNYSGTPRDAAGLINWDRVINSNQYSTLFGVTKPTYDPFYSPNEFKSSNVLVASVNNHKWLGYLGQFNYEMNSTWSFSGGLDYRMYKGEHYREVVDLLGGNYYVNSGNANSNNMKRKGDKVADAGKPYENHRDGLVQWGGVFGQAEYSGARWTAFVNLTGVYNGYKGVDYFRKKEMHVADTVLLIGFKDTVNFGGQTYTTNSSGLKDNQTDWKWIPGATIKAGAGYNLNENSNVFINLGYLSRTPMFTSVVDNRLNEFFPEIKNEVISALELGYNISHKKFGINVNAYATNWKNKPFPNGLRVPDPQDPQTTININVQGMDAVHLGIELDGVYAISKKISLEGAISYGDWTWNSSQTLNLPNYDTTITFNAKGVHVGDAPQSSYSAGIRYEPKKNLYIKVQYMYFDRFYADFNPFSLRGADAGRDSWQSPSYGLMNLFAGYRYRFKSQVSTTTSSDLFVHLLSRKKNTKLRRPELVFNGSITNVLNTRFISDANHSDIYGPGFDQNSVGVMYGSGLRFNLGIAIQF